MTLLWNLLFRNYQQLKIRNRIQYKQNENFNQKIRYLQFINIIFMMIKNIIKFQTQTTNTQTNLLFGYNRLGFQSLNSYKPSYQFRSQKFKSFFDKFNENKKVEIKAFDAKKIRDKILTSSGYLRMADFYFKTVSKYNISSLSPFLNKLKSINEDLSSLKTKKYSKFSYSNFKNTIGQQNLVFLITRYVILSITFFVILNVLKSLKYQTVVDLNELNLDKPQYALVSTFEQTLSNMKKIYIYIQPQRMISGSQSQQNSRPQSSTSQDINVKKLTTYKIILQDQNGKKYVANPYLGDPNNLLKYIESIQERHPRGNKIQVIYQNASVYSYYDALKDTLGFITPFIPIALTIYIFRKTDPTTFLSKLGTGAKQFKVQAMKDIKTRFSDVAGMDQAKKQITQFVDFLKNNEKYRLMGAKIPKGALLTGPPGTGKTMLAKACAGQAGVAFFYISGSQFVEVFVGLGASKVRDLFTKARQNAPSIIFIDQIDAIGKKRQTSRNQQKDTTLNQLLVQMDGFSSHQTIVVLAATNRKQTLDNALTRPGRFDRMVQITLPDVKARQQIFMVHLAPLKIDPNTQIRVIAKRLSQLSPGFSGADIANLCNQAAIIATRKNREYIIDLDFEQATQRITAGYVKKSLMKQKTKKRVAYHQSGHAVSSWFLRGGDPLVKLTIIPRSKGALGYAQYLPKTSYIMTKDDMIDKVAIMLGGITTQQIFFGEISSGGSDDLQKVYSLTRRMITQFGMGKDTYNMTLDEQSYVQKQSSYLIDKMEEQVRDLINEAKKRSRDIIQSKRDVIQKLAKQLMEKETLNKDEILAVMGERPTFTLLQKIEQAEKKQVL